MAGPDPRRQQPSTRWRVERCYQARSLWSDATVHADLATTTTMTTIGRVGGLVPSVTCVICNVAVLTVYTHFTVWSSIKNQTMNKQQTFDDNDSDIIFERERNHKGSSCISSTIFGWTHQRLGPNHIEFGRGPFAPPHNRPNTMILQVYRACCRFLLFSFGSYYLSSLKFVFLQMWCHITCTIMPRDLWPFILSHMTSKPVHDLHFVSICISLHAIYFLLILF